jgi:NRPS condensation-like uncharacterized protein
MLPLPLTCFEEYLFRDDSPAYPMTLVIRLRLAGFLEPSSFQNALEIVLRRHPLLRATISRKRFGRLTWVDNTDRRPVIHWHAQGDANGFPETPYLDLTREPGIRIWVMDRDTGNDVIMQIHHCCTDGKGMMVFIEDMLIAYVLQYGTTESGLALRELEPGRLRERATPDLSGWKYLKAILLQMGVLNGVREFFMRSPSPLSDTKRVPPQSAVPVSHVSPLFLTCEQDETRRMVSAARSYGATLNDLLLRDLFLAVGAWRAKKGMGHAGEWLRFSVPVNLRTAADEKAPMANSISLIFFDRQRKDLERRDRLLQSIQHDMMVIRRHFWEYSYIFSIGITRLLPGGLTLLRQDNRCYATTCFSNVGRILDKTPLPTSEGRLVAGNVLLESIDVVAPPLRPHMDVSFNVHTYGGRLQLVLNYDSRVLSVEDARELLDLYLEEIRRTVQEAPAS